jgi:hypothetical protein
LVLGWLQLREQAGRLFLRWVLGRMQLREQAGRLFLRFKNGVGGVRFG